MLQDFFFIGECICGIFQSEHEVVLWHPRQLLLLSLLPVESSIFSNVSDLNVQLVHSVKCSDANDYNEK